MTFKSVAKSLGLKNEINWYTTTYLTLYHAIGLYWCWHYTFPAKLSTLLFAWFMYIFTGFSVTCGVHRYFSHRSYKVNTPLKILLIFGYCAAGQYSLYQWVWDHRLHHKRSDTDADPHNASRGFFFSHIGWLMTKRNDEVKREGKKIDMSDLQNDKMIMFEEKYFLLLKFLLCFVLPTTLNVYLLNEDWKCAVAWQCFIRFLSVLHFTFTVNSIAHAYGYQPYNKNILPRENDLVTAFVLGEGCHNYHHSFPFDYKTAECFDFLNWSTKLISWWAKMGWAYDLKEASPEMIRSVMKRVGDQAYIDPKLCK